MSDIFYEEQKVNSAVKTTIVTKYFSAWAKIMKLQFEKGRIRCFAYIDLYSGPGVYEDGSESTPMQIARFCAQDETLSKLCYLILNDKDKQAVDKLRINLEKAGLDKKIKHVVYSSIELTVENSKNFPTFNCPAFSFIDPFGYAGLTMPLLQTLLDSWGSDLVFFFNINRINAAVDNPKVDVHMSALFTARGLRKIKDQIRQERPGTERRIMIILNGIIDSLKENSWKELYCLPFEFQTEQRVSHYLVFISQHKLGFRIMKEIMNKESSLVVDGVGSFRFCPQEQMYGLGLLEPFGHPLADLGSVLLSKFQGRTLSVKALIEEDTYCTYFTAKNYKDTLRMLEHENKLLIKPSAKDRKKNTLADDALLTFLNID